MTQTRARTIPAPPPDPALPALPTALDGGAMRELLSHHLEGVTVLACEPRYVRYKPRTNCIVEYALQLGEDGERPAYVKLRGKPSASSAAYLPELDAVLHVYPFDPALPALASVATREGFAGARARLGAREEHGGDVELLRYKPARKALLRCGTTYAKLHAHDRGEQLVAVARELRSRGVPTVRPLGYLPDLRLLAHEHVDGVSLRALRRGPGFVDGVRAAAEVLAHLHATPVIADLPVRTRADEGAALAAAARAVGVLRPDLAARAAAACDAIAERLAAAPAAPAVLHGDFYDDQVVLGADGAVLLDFDRSARGEPLLDVGAFCAHLVANGEHEARAAFLDAYGVTDDAVAAYEAATLLRISVEPFRRLEHDWPAQVERLLELAEARVGVRAAIDPALPQLAVLGRPALAAEVVGSPLSAAAVVRHKPGRRAILRYDLLHGGRLYGKTFASERGPRVARTLAAIADVDAFGAGVALPRLVAYHNSLRLLLQREVRGVPARAALVAGDTRLAAAIADAVAALHASDVELERRHDLEHEIAAVRGRLEPTAARAHELVARAESRAGRAEWRYRPVHRDFYYGQVVVDGTALGVLDLDDAALSEPAVDIANFLAHLRLLALEEPGATEPLAAVARAFRVRAHERDTLLDDALVRALESATLVRLACIHDTRAEALLDAAGDAA